MIKWVNKNWKIIKIVMLNWLIFSLLVALAVNWYLVQKIKEQDRQLGIYEHNIAEIEKQIKYGSIILKLK